MWRTLLSVAFGFALGSVREWWTYLRARKNLRAMLFSELRYDFGRLNQVVPREKGRIPPFEHVARVLLEKHPHLNEPLATDEGEIPPPSLLADVCDSFSFSVYERCLGQIGSLKKDDIHKIQSAYLSMRDTLKDARPVVEVPLQFQHDERQKRRYINHGTVLVCSCERVLAAISAALKVLPGGEKALRELQAERGKQIELYLEGTRRLTHELQKGKSCG